MARTTTTRIALSKPTPGTNEPVNPAIDLGSNWDKVDAAIGATICTSGTRPATPYDGQIIRETDTRRMYIWNATNAVWDQIGLFYPNGSIATGAGASSAGLRLITSGTAAGNRGISFRGSGDTQDHWFVDYDGVMQWGSGSAVADTNLYRPSAGKLKTDDDFEVAGNLTVGGNLAGLQKRIATTVRTAPSSTFTTTETSVDNVVAAVVTGRTYRVLWWGRMQSTVADGYVRLRIREDNVAGNQLQLSQALTNGVANQSFPVPMECEFTAASTGNKTFHITAVRQVGTGTISSFGAADSPNYTYVDYIRG